MKRIILLKYGELALNGLNRATFEASLMRDLRHRLPRYGRFDIIKEQSTVIIEPREDADIDGAYSACAKVFGIATISLAYVAEKSMDDIIQCVRQYIPAQLEGVRSFKCDAKRSDKRFPLNTPQICAEIGGVILEECPGLRVYVHTPEAVVTVEIRTNNAYIRAGAEKGAGGMPLGSSGHGLLLLSGGIDSPVAGWLMAKRGLRLTAVHFTSPPYTSPRARDKAFRLAQVLSSWAGSIRFVDISLSHIQEEIHNKCEQDYHIILLRRFMMELASKVADDCGAGALITGESLAQVASQTLGAIAVTDAAASLPVFRPLIGTDKIDIIELARKIESFDISVEPSEDCCTVFTPRHPVTNPKLPAVLEQEARLDRQALIEEALGTIQAEVSR